MYLILTYDVEAKKAAKTARVVKKYLRHVQRSVFEGNITEAKLRRLKEELAKRLDPEKDSVRIYEMGSVDYTRLEVLGKAVSVSTII